MKNQILIRTESVRTHFRLPGLKSSANKIKNSIRLIHDNATNSERFLILFAALSGAFFLFFELYPPSASDFFSRFEPKSVFWQLLFFSATALHLTVLYLNLVSWRKVSCLIYSVIWLALFLLSVTAALPTMATPLAFGLFAMGFYEAARLKLKENE